MGCTNKRKLDEKSEKLEYFFKNYLTPLFWIAKTSATWRLKIASKSFDAFFPRKRRKVPRFQLKKTSDRKISWYLCTAKYEATFCTALTFCQNFTQIGVKIIIYLSLSLVLPFVSHRLHLARKYVHQRKVWKRGISLNSEMNEVFTLYCTAIWQLQNNTYRPELHTYFKR